MVITQPHIVARLISMPASRNKATLCRNSGLWSQYLFTTVLIITRSDTRLLSMIRIGRVAAVTPCSGQVLQALFSRLVTCTKYRAGSTSSTSPVSYTHLRAHETD